MKKILLALVCTSILAITGAMAMADHPSSGPAATLPATPESPTTGASDTTADVVPMSHSTLCYDQCDEEWDICIGPNGGQDDDDVARCDYYWEQCMEDCSQY